MVRRVSNLRGSTFRQEVSHIEAGISFIQRIVAEASQWDVCVYGPLQWAPVELSPVRVSRVVRRYYRFGIQSGASLSDFLAEHLRLTDEMRYRIVRHRDWERALMYLDPTGSAAADNADRNDNE